MLTISAAAVGVGALKSATKSEIVTSVSWPIAEIVGRVDWDIHLATFSSLKDHKSSIEPPPLARITKSTSFLTFAVFKAFIIPSTDPDPWTEVG